MTLVVTPDVLRSTQQAIEAALEHATAIANGYLSTHEGLGSAVWGGQAQAASVNTAAQITFAGAALGAMAFGSLQVVWFDPMLYAVVALTLASTAAYLAQWLRHMGS